MNISFHNFPTSSSSHSSHDPTTSQNSIKKSINNELAQFEVLAQMLLKIKVVSDMMLCCWANSPQHFEES
jgi:hypothetical protein